MTGFIYRTVCALLAGVAIAYLTKTRHSVMVFALLTMGAAVVCYISSEYLKQYSVYAVSDPARLGAQVVAVVGFIGSGLFLATGKEKNLDLSSAAGLWVSAIVGLLIGVGMVKTALLSVVTIFFIYYGTDFLIAKKRKE